MPKPEVRYVSNLCKYCKHRFRVVSLPYKVGEDEDEGPIITVYCMVITMDLTDGEVIDCSHYEEKDLQAPEVLIDLK